MDIFKLIGLLLETKIGPKRFITNPAYGRHWISWHVWIVVPIQKRTKTNRKGKNSQNVSHVACSEYKGYAKSDGSQRPKNLMGKNIKKKFSSNPILAIHFLTKSFQSTGKWFFLNGMDSHTHTTSWHPAGARIRFLYRAKPSIII